MYFVISGLIGTGVSGVATYKCGKLFFDQLRHDDEQRTLLKNNIKTIDDIFDKKTEQIVLIPLSKPVSIFDVYKTQKIGTIQYPTYHKDNTVVTKISRSLGNRHQTIYTEQYHYNPFMFSYSDDIIEKKFYGTFITDATFNNPNIVAGSDLQLLVRSKLSSIRNYSGEHLEKLLNENSRLNIKCGNLDNFEVSEFCLNDKVYLFGKTVENKFVYTMASDDENKIINKLTDTNESALYFVGTSFSIIALVASAFFTIGELSKK